MDLVRTLVTLGRGEREKEKIKVRQPLQKILVDGKYESLISDMVSLIEEELNIKEVVFEKQMDTYMNYSLKPNFKVAGPVLGKDIKAFGQVLAAADTIATVAEFEANGKVTLKLNGEDVDINKDMVDISITAKEGFAVAMENGIFTILDTTITPELISEGLARELISKIQQMRKQKDFEMMDNIIIQVKADDEAKAAFEEHRDYIMTETLAIDMNYFEGELPEYNLNGHITGIDVEKVQPA
jgi:isoleucyl-tRNA synthetase